LYKICTRIKEIIKTINCNIIIEKQYFKNKNRDNDENLALRH